MQIDCVQFFFIIFIAPAEGVTWNLVSAQGSEETRMMRLPDGRKTF